MDWAKSSFSAATNCVEWRKASASNPSGNCVEAHTGSQAVFVRDSKDPDGIILRYSPELWDDGRAVAFIPCNARKVDDRLRQAALDNGHDPAAQWYWVYLPAQGMLFFDQSEVDAWRAGVEAGEFRFEAVTA